uniref:Isochorismatase-like domain-containing protein n=1 Tax=Palpitomonas bilix TaxID=652834 RepID=A0A7S3DAC2_9EUKA|mmetsp:Transcript_28261/g.72106  ORF Transcript_28261/g.72106 Transcript_28261/m.72106 type:complete len:378 (+) Transcript_28261:105-1238(+)
MPSSSSRGHQPKTSTSPFKRILLFAPIALGCLYLAYLAGAYSQARPREITVARGGDLIDPVKSGVGNIRRGQSGKEQVRRKESEEEEEIEVTDGGAEKKNRVVSKQVDNGEGREYWRTRNIGEKCKKLKEELGEDARDLMDNYALIVIDLWDKHWCTEGKRTMESLVCRMKDFLPQMRECGVPIVFSPGPELMNRYAGHSARLLAKKAPDVPGLKESNKDKRTDWPAMPTKSWYTDRDGGCSKLDPRQEVWTRIHPSIEIKDGDFIAVESKELQRILKWTGKKGFIYSGVHTNICIAVSRTYSLLRLADVGVETAIMLDMTDSLISKRTDSHIRDRKHLADLYGEYFHKTVGTTVVHSFDLIPGFDEEYTANDCLPY